MVEQFTRAAESPSMIGKDLIVTGNVTSNGELRVDGHIQGDVRCGLLVLGETSQIEGNVVADEVVIRGRLIGSVRALRVTLQSKSHVEGDLFHNSLAIERGTHFEGESRPSENPLSSSLEVPAVEPQLNHNGRPGAVKQRGLSKGFIRSLPESGSA